MARSAAHPPRRHGLRRIVATAGILVGGLLAAPGAMAARPASCPHADTPIGGAPAGEMRAAVVCLINRERTERHLPRLVANRRLDESAQRWTDVMVVSDTFSHGRAFMDRISAAGFDWTTAGENIAAGFATPVSVVDAWMASPDHCANILDPLYREVGTGVSSRGIPRATSLYGTWTQDFGRLMSQPALSHDFAPARACYRH